MFVPQFTMVNEEGKKFEDQVIPEAIPLIQAREDRNHSGPGCGQCHGHHSAQHQGRRR